MNTRRRTRDRLARALLILAIRLLPARRSAWGAAMRAEFEALAAEEASALAWASGCLGAALKARSMEPIAAYAAIAAGFVTALIYVEWHTDEVFVTLGLLLIAGGVLGFLHPRHVPLTGLLLGECLLAAHTFSNVTGLFVPFYQCKPLTVADGLTVAALLAPALFSAGAGALARRATLGR